MTWRRRERGLRWKAGTDVTDEVFYSALCSSLMENLSTVIHFCCITLLSLCSRLSTDSTTHPLQLFFCDSVYQNTILKDVVQLFCNIVAYCNNICIIASSSLLACLSESQLTNTYIIFIFIIYIHILRRENEKMIAEQALNSDYESLSFLDDKMR